MRIDDARARRSPVCACVPLMSVSPSFGPSVTGASPARAQHVGGRRRVRRRGCSVAFADEREREVRERREIAARADAALLRNRRIEPGVEHRRRAGRRARRARRSSPWRCTFARSSIIARDFALAGADRPTPAAWLRTRLTCSSASRVRRDRDLGQLAESGRHAIRDGAALDERGDDGVRLFHARARRPARARPAHGPPRRRRRRRA